MINRFSSLMLFKELMPVHPIFMKMFLLYSDIPEKFDLMQEIDYTQQLEQQMEQLIPQLEQMQKQLQQNSEELEKAMTKNELIKLRGALNQVTTKYREQSQAALREKELLDQLQRERKSNGD